MSGNLFCEIYVDAPEERNVFTGKIGDLLNGRRSGYEIITEWAIVDVLGNDECGERFEDPRDEFLAYRYKLEFEWEAGRQISRTDYIAHVGELLRKLWGGGYKAVAACSFEDELPKKGGYLRS